VSKYHCLVAGLPNIAFDGGKPPYAVLWFKDELVNHLTKADMRLLELLFLKVDNNNLLEQLRFPDYDPEPGGKITAEELNVLITGLQNVIDSQKERDRQIEENVDEDDLPPIPLPFKNKNKRLPAYFVTFAKMYLEAVGNEEELTIPWEDRLSSMYYEYAMKSANAFIAAWFELNLNINNIFTALTCRKHKLDRANYVVGETEVADKLRTSTARHFELGETLEYWPAVLRIAEDADLLQREWKTDLLKWEWLDERIYVRVFDIDSVLVYMLKLEMLERWTSLDKTTGDKAFRQLVGAMKEGSNHTLEEFKRNNKK
jgi:hypothetical protein